MLDLVTLAELVALHLDGGPFGDDFFQTSVQGPGACLTGHVGGQRPKQRL